MPEWYLVIGALAATAALGALWMPLLAAVPLLLVAVALLIAHAVAGGLRGRYTKTTRRQRWRLRALTAGLYVAQPLARLWGRAGYGLTPWRRRGPRGLAFPWPRQRRLWSEAWQAPEKRLKELAAHLSRDGAVVRHGAAEDRWDLEVRGGGCAATRTLMAVEEHGSGRQLVRFRTWPTAFPLAIVALALVTALAVWAGLDGATAAAAVLGGLAGLVLLATLKESATATASLLRGFERLDRAERERVEADPVKADANGRAIASVSRVGTVRSTGEAPQPPRRARAYR
jgi:hypothetical protein